MVFCNYFLIFTNSCSFAMLGLQITVSMWIWRISRTKLTGWISITRLIYKDTVTQLYNISWEKLETFKITDNGLISLRTDETMKYKLMLDCMHDSQRFHVKKKYWLKMRILYIALSGVRGRGSLKVKWSS